MATNKSKAGGHRWKIGIMVGTFYSDYTMSVISELYRRFSDTNVDLYIYPGADTIRYRNTFTMIDEGSGSHYYSLYGYSKFEDLDLLVVSFGTISGVQNTIALEEFLSGLSETPIILLENDTDIPNGMHITMDDYAGLRDCMEHLIEGHGCRNIAYLSGPKNLKDSAERLRAYQETMLAHGLPFREERIAYGDFSDQVDSLVEQLFMHNKQLDAIVCANDMMAESAYRVAKKHGYVVGQDIAVTGFDDLPMAWAMDPPLTTVRQDYEGLAEAVEKSAWELLDGKKAASVVLPTKLIERMSCGCKTVKRIETDSPFLVQNMRKSWEELKEHRFQNLMCSVLFRNMLSEFASIRYFCRRLGEQLQMIETKNAALFLTEEPMRLEEKDKMYVPKALRLCLLLDEEEMRVHDLADAEIFGYGDLGKVIHTTGKDSVIATYLLYCGAVQYGLFCVEIPLDKLVFYYTLSLEIGSGLRHLHLAMEQQQMRLELEKKNQELHYAATRDILTGLYNRNGVIQRAVAFVHEYKKGDRFAAIMADLDHLKQINDTFGHGEGDAAICAAANILKEALPEGSPAGRSGGDEFSCMFFLEAEKQVGQFQQRVKELCDAFNETSGKPYYVNISIGCHVFSFDEIDDLSLITNLADKQLYEAKKYRRKNVVRELGDMQQKKETVASYPCESG